MAERVVDSRATKLVTYAGAPERLEGYIRIRVLQDQYIPWKLSPLVCKTLCLLEQPAACSKIVSWVNVPQRECQCAHVHVIFAVFL